MWFLVAILIIAAGFVGYFIAKKTIKPEVITETKTVEVEVPPVDYNDYLAWKENQTNIKEIISDEVYNKIVSAIGEFIDDKLEDMLSTPKTENAPLDNIEIKHLKAKVRTKVNKNQ